jgi:hypothetical protein
MEFVQLSTVDEGGVGSTVDEGGVGMVINAISRPAEPQIIAIQFNWIWPYFMQA